MLSLSQHPSQSPSPALKLKLNSLLSMESISSPIKSPEPTDIPSCEACEDCKLSTDIVFRSSDGRRFGAHSRNIEIYSDGFPIRGSVTTEKREDVVLSESSDVVHLLLQFMHNRPQPDLRSTPFELLSKLAEAAQKYCVYSAIGICKLLMERNAQEHSFEVYVYASRAGYSDIREKAGTLAIAQNPLRVFSYAVWANDVYTRDKAAWATLDLDADDVIYSLSRYYTVFTKWHHIFVAWVKFRDHIYATYYETLRNPPQIKREHIAGDCLKWNEIYPKLLKGRAWTSFVDAVEEYAYLIEDCDTCSDGVDRWRTQIAAALSGASPFSSFVKTPPTT
ncbi:hypothetical protein VNI00_014974 [Paramarasmius palmivorus]|uniref:BTB domain-containing protein n=1 Tax=Paramarasmius palmivorus TaxID=297713 RepID=A0AAW0BPJ9_9AGAR